MIVVCISTFIGAYKINNITIGNKYNTRFVSDGNILIKNDLNEPQMVNFKNFIKFNKYISYEK
jgi:hypothetical protein